jgi:transcriptional regulator with XRE-family HTH domain
VSEASDKRAIGHRLGLIERMYGLTGQTLAEQLGIPKQTWSRYRVGNAYVSHPIARTLRDRFGCSLDWIFIGDESNNRADFQARLNALYGISATPFAKGIRVKLPTLAGAEALHAKRAS